jgi:hypothetical protein
MFVLENYIAALKDDMADVIRPGHDGLMRLETDTHVG